MSADTKKTVLSCIQPTGDMHYGNYFGAVKNWVDLQSKYDCIYGIVDYHAMTMPYQADKLRQNVWDLALNLMAVGVKQESIFIQSLVPEHAELCWILGCSAAYGEVTRMTQFKDKSSKVKEAGKENFISGGLFYYPVLQAADILIYKADYVPVGKDQGQHLELTRHIAHRFNQQFGKEYFILPETLYTDTPKIMSTADPTRKMSKSAGPKHHINVFDDLNKIRKQIKSAVTDAGEDTNGEMSPGVQNLFQILKAAGGQTEHDALLEDFTNGSLKYSHLKEVVGDVLVGMSTDFIERKNALGADKKEMKNAIKASSYEIRKKAQATLKEVKSLIGLQNIRY